MFDMDAAGMSTDQIASGKYEKGFISAVKILSDYIPDFQIMFIIEAFIIALFVGIIMFRYCKVPYLGFFFFLTFGLYFNSLNFMRQMLAAFIAMYSLIYIKKNQFFRFLIVILFAACFHYSALLMIPFFFILKIKVNIWSLGVYATVLTLVMIFSWNIFDFVTDYVYKTYAPEINIEMSGGLSPIYSIYFGICFILCFVFRDRLVKKDSFNNVLINCMFFTFFFEMIGTKHAIISRFSLLFMIPAATLLMPQLVTVIVDLCRSRFIKDSKKATIISALSVSAVIAVCVGMFSYFTIFKGDNGYNGVVPYRTVFETDRGAEQ